MTDPKTHTLEVPGAILTYDIREGEANDKPILLLIGSPMGASGFGTLAGYFSDRTVVTYDPRGIERSTRTDNVVESTPELHAADLSRLITEIGGPVDIFASSGGAVNALALVAAHPEQVRTLVAHEPPAAQTLPDRENALAAVMDIRDTYEREGIGAGMAKFIAITGHKGEVPADVFTNQPLPDPSVFGLPAEDDGTRDDALIAQNLVSCTHYNPDFDALRAASTRIVLAVGVESEGELAYRSGVAVAERLGLTPVDFPSNHGGFLGDEYGMPGDPEGFAAKLHEVLGK